MRIIADVEFGWKTSTFIFYLLIILMSFFVTKVFSHTNIRINSKNKTLNLGLILSFLLLFVVKGFGTTGRDLRNGYLMNFNSATSLQNYYDYTVEIGFRLLMVFVKNVFNNYEIFIVIASLLTLLPVFYVLNKRKSEIDISIAVLLYSAIYFIPSLSALRNSLSASISLLAFDQMIDKNPLSSLFFLILSSLFHNSAIFIFVLYIAQFYKLINKRIVMYGSVFIFVLLFLFRPYLSTVLSMFERYSIYTSFENVDIGFQQIVYYLPLFYIYILRSKNSTNNDLKKLFFIVLTIGFLYGMLGYVISIVGRIQDIYLPIILVMSYMAKEIKAKINKAYIINYALLMYCLMRFIMFVKDYYMLQDLMPYTNMFGIIIG